MFSILCMHKHVYMHDMHIQGNMQIHSSGSDEAIYIVVKILLFVLISTQQPKTAVNTESNSNFFQKLQTRVLATLSFQKCSIIKQIINSSIWKWLREIGSGLERSEVAWRDLSSPYGRDLYTPWLGEIYTSPYGSGLERSIHPHMEVAWRDLYIPIWKWPGEIYTSPHGSGLERSIHPHMEVAWRDLYIPIWKWLGEIYTPPYGSGLERSIHPHMEVDISPYGSGP